MKNKKSIRLAKRIKGECSTHTAFECLCKCKYYYTCANILLPRIKDFDSPEKTNIKELSEVLKGHKIKYRRWTSSTWNNLYK